MKLFDSFRSDIWSNSATTATARTGVCERVQARHKQQHFHIVIENNNHLCVSRSRRHELGMTTRTHTDVKCVSAGRQTARCWVWWDCYDGPTSNWKQTSWWTSLFGLLQPNPPLYNNTHAALRVCVCMLTAEIPELEQYLFIRRHTKHSHETRSYLEV